MSVQLLSPCSVMAIVGFGGVNPLGESQQSFLTRTERFEEAVPELARQMSLVRQEGIDRFFPLQTIEHGRAVDAPEALRDRPLTRDEVVLTYRRYVDDNIGLRVYRPEDTETHYNPQQFESYPLQELTEDTVIEGRLYRAGQKVRVPRVDKHAVSHAGVIPAGMDLAQLGGFPRVAPYSGAYARVHYMFDYALAMAIARMGIPWSTVEEAIPSANRGCASSVGMGAGRFLDHAFTAPILGLASGAGDIAGMIPDSPGFFAAKRVGAQWNAARTAACNTGPANLEILFNNWYSAGLLFGVLLTGESAVNAATMQAFNASTTLATDQDVARLKGHPSLASRPGAHDRSGFSLSEMAECLLFMDLEVARRLGAIVYGILWCAQTAMGPRMGIMQAAPTPGSQFSGEKAIVGAAKRMGISPQEAANRIRMINAHLTSTPAGDPMGVSGHNAVLEKLGHDPRNPVWIWGQKGGPSTGYTPGGREHGIGIGHGLGGSGSAALGETLWALKQGIVPPMIGGLDILDPELRNLRHLAYSTRATRVEANLAWTSSQGFNDSNGDAVTGTYDPDEFEGDANEGGQAESRARRDENLQALREGRLSLHDDVLPPITEKT